MLGVLKRTISMVPNIEVHKTQIKQMDKKIIRE